MILHTPKLSILDAFFNTSNSKEKNDTQRKIMKKRILYVTSDIT